MHRSILLTFLLTIACSVSTAAELPGFPKLTTADWPWWRGPARNGVAEESAAPPTKWDAETNIVWKTPVPGRGHASPIVVGKQIFLATADEKAEVQSVVSFDRANGKPLWKTDVSRGGFTKRNHPKNTEATSTIACDGERLIATFFHDKTIEAVALDLQGKELWRKTVGPFDPKKYEYGFAPSPLIYKDTVIIALEWDRDSFLYALDRHSGKEVWRAPRPNNISFSSPVVANVAGRDQLLISGAQQIISYDPATGKQLWAVDGASDATCGTVVWDGDLVFASGGYPQSETLAIRADGSGEVVWRNRQKCYEQSMLAHDGYLYALTGGGVAFCWRASDGKEMWSQRLKGPVSASPVFAAGNIYWANELGTMFVFQANPTKFTLVAQNQLDNESFASPAVVGRHLYLRTATSGSGARQEILYCIGQ